MFIHPKSQYPEAFVRTIWLAELLTPVETAKPPAVVALLAEVALPLRVAVIVPAEKFPDASRATMVDAVFALVALDVTVNVAALDWLAVNV